MVNVEKRIQFFCENIAKIRKSKGYSAEQVADELGMHPNAYNAYERGVRYPPLPKIFAIADFLKVPMSELFCGSDIPIFKHFNNEKLIIILKELYNFLLEKKYIDKDDLDSIIKAVINKIGDKFLLSIIENRDE